MSRIDYRSKYIELKSKFMNTVDLSWRLGYEQGLKDAQMEQMQQQAQADAMAAQQPQQPGQEGEQVPQDQEQAAMQQDTQDDELGQHIEKLENMLGKSEISSLELENLKKTLNDIRSLQTQINLTKSMESIRGLKLNKSLVLSPKTEANLSEPAKKALSLQQKIVEDVFKKWETDSSKTASGISSILSVEGLTKSDK